MASQKNNKWSDKLNQFPTPDETESWNRMEVLLDTHLPKQKSNWRYASIALLLLLLVIGVCKYVPLKKGYSGNNKSDVQNQSASGMMEKRRNSTAVANTTKNSVEKENSGSEVTPDKSKKEHKAKSSLDHIHSPGNKRSNIDISKESYSSKDIEKSYTKASLSTATDLINPKEQNLNKRTAKTHIDKTVDRNQPASSKTVGLDKVDSSSTTFVKDSATKDSVNTNVHIPKKQPKQKNTKLSFGTGLNYFFAVDEQKHSTANAKGNDNNWSNFFPVIMGRYYIKEWLYLQAELQPSAPQYTGKILIDKKVSPPPGPSPAANMRIEKSIFTNKFFYVDLPVSVNVSPVKNVFLGGGLQYSNLRKAVGLYEDKLVATGRPDSTISIQIKPMDENLATATFKSNEWRYNLNGTFKLNRFDVGIRYTRSFRPFTTTLVTGYSKSQMTNSSLSVFLRYELIRLRVNPK